ncbi:hypothetical protein Avbf_16624, partial [Armadillidium vulgare]
KERSTSNVETSADNESEETLFSEEKGDIINDLIWKVLDDTDQLGLAHLKESMRTTSQEQIPTCSTINTVSNSQPSSILGSNYLIRDEGNPSKELYSNRQLQSSQLNLLSCLLEGTIKDEVSVNSMSGFREREPSGSSRDSGYWSYL